MTARPNSLLKSILTMLTGGIVAQIIPLLAGPLLARLYSPEAFGIFTGFSTISASITAVACARYEFALPIAHTDEQAHTLLALCLRILLLVAFISFLIGIAWQIHDHESMMGLLSLSVLTAGLQQILIMWINRAQKFRLLAISRFVQYSFAATLQLFIGYWFYQKNSQKLLGGNAAWMLVLGPIAACFLACFVLLRPSPVGGWRSVWPPTQDKTLQSRLFQTMHEYREFPLINAPHAFLGTLQDALAVYILVAYSGSAAAGFWGLSLRYLKAPASLVGGAVSQVLYSRLAQVQPAEAQQIVRRVMAFLGAVALAIMIFLLLTGPELFVILFGKDWHDAGELTRALAPYIAVHFVAAPLSVVTIAWGTQGWAFRWALVGQTAFVLTLALGLRFFDLITTAWAISSVMIIYFAIYFYRLAFWPTIPDAARKGLT